MKCPYCGYNESKVVDSRPTEESVSIRRRRECLKCGKRFTTYEIIEDIPIIVIKKDHSHEAFDKNKIITGLIKATEKRPVTMQQLNDIANDIEAQIQNKLEREISSIEIGEMIMTRLKDLDEVSYVRFASVYRQFKDINSFMEELKALIEKDTAK